MEITLKEITSAMESLLETKLEAKLIPLRNDIGLMKKDIGLMKNDLHILKISTASMNSRLGKLENRMANMELKIDRTDRIVNLLKNTA